MIPTHDHPSRFRSERGGVSTEFAIVMAVVLASFFALAIYGGRVVQAENDVHSAAHAAARAATLERSPEAAHAAAQAVAATNLEASGVACAGGTTVDVDLSRFGPGGDVTVTVTCTASFSDVASLRVGSSRAFTASATEVVDLYRGP